MAVWRTRASPGPGLPTCTSSHCRTSGPPVLWKRMAWGICVTPSGEVFLEEVGRALIGLIGRSLVVMRAADARESVILLVVCVDGDERIAFERVLDLGLRLGRHKLVLRRHVQQQRLLEVLRFAQRILNANAVVADV